MGLGLPKWCSAVSTQVAVAHDTKDPQLVNHSVPYLLTNLFDFAYPNSNWLGVAVEAGGCSHRQAVLCDYEGVFASQGS